MESKWTTSAHSTLAALQLATLIWFGCHHVSRYYTIWFIAFVQSFWTCLFFLGDRMFAYIPLLRGPPDLYYDLKENPWLTSLVVYFVLPWVAAVPEDRSDNLRDYDERDESWWRRWTLLSVAEVALAAATTAAILYMIVERRDQVRRLFFPALRRGGSDLRISERGEVGCDVSSTRADESDECGPSKTDDDSEDTPTKSPDDREGETCKEDNNLTASARFDALSPHSLDSSVIAPPHAESRSEAETAIQLACRAIIREEATEPGRGVNAARRLLQYLENIRRHPDEERYRRLNVSNPIFRGAIYDTAALGVLEALGFEEQGGYVEFVLDWSAGCGPGVSFATQTVNETLEEMTTEQTGNDSDARAAREKRLAAAEGRLTKQDKRATKAKKKSDNAPLRGPNSQNLMRWT